MCDITELDHPRCRLGSLLVPSLHDYPFSSGSKVKGFGIFFLIRDHMLDIIKKENIRTYYNDLGVDGHGDT